MPETGVFYYGDNLKWMRRIPDACVDLIYLDPPFNSDRRFSQLFPERDLSPSEAQRVAFDDTWRWGAEAEKAYDALTFPRERWRVPLRFSETIQMLRALLKNDENLMAYLVMMGIRLIEMYRVLKPTGSLYLHCDSSASHYLKLLLDAVFGPDRFLNEVCWKRTTAHNDPQRYGRITDRLLFYSKSDEKTFHPKGGEYSEAQLSRYKGEDANGRFKCENLTAPNFSSTRTKTWRGTHPGKKRQWRFGEEELERLWEAGKIATRRDGRPRKDGLKEYLDEQEGPVLQDVWTDIIMAPTSAERLGYPTQKPRALLERIIEASSDPDDVVLDPFCGCGTTIEAAQFLGRRWIGIDITHLAVSVLRRRMEARFPDVKIPVHGEPSDVAGAMQLAADDPWEFQAWVVDRVGGIPLQPLDAKTARAARKGGDKGIDGVLLFRDDPKAQRSKKIILSVKAGQTLSPAMVRELHGTMVREKVPMAALLTATDPTEGMRREARAAGRYSSEVFAPNEKFDAIQILSVRDIFERDKKLMFPGWNSSHQSIPPLALAGATLDLFDQTKRKPTKPIRSTRRPAPPPDEQSSKQLALSAGSKEYRVPEVPARLVADRTTTPKRRR